jgi:hypothetical protein
MSNDQPCRACLPAHVLKTSPFLNPFAQKTGVYTVLKRQAGQRYLRLKGSGDSGNPTYSNMTSRITSGDELNYRKGLGLGVERWLILPTYRSSPRRSICFDNTCFIHFGCECFFDPAAADNAFASVEHCRLSERDAVFGIIEAQPFAG